MQRPRLTRHIPRTDSCARQVHGLKCLPMFILIVGAGRVCSAVANRALEAGHEVAGPDGRHVRRNRRCDRRKCQPELGELRQDVVERYLLPQQLVYPRADRLRQALDMGRPAHRISRAGSGV